MGDAGDEEGHADDSKDDDDCGNEDGDVDHVGYFEMADDADTEGDSDDPNDD